MPRYNSILLIVSYAKFFNLDTVKGKDGSLLHDPAAGMGIGIGERTIHQWLNLIGAHNAGATSTVISDVALVLLVMVKYHL